LRYLDIAVAENVLDQQHSPQFKTVNAVTGDSQEVSEAAHTYSSIETRPGIFQCRVDPQGSTRQQTARLSSDVTVTW